MFKFQGDTLSIQKVETPSLDTNVMLDIQNAYKNYIEKRSMRILNIFQNWFHPTMV